MVTIPQVDACVSMDKEGLHGVELIYTGKTPIPGLLLFIDEGHSRLEMILPDGRCVDLLKVYQAAKDCVRNWHRENPLNLPQFVGDFKRLTAIAMAVNGRTPGGEANDQTTTGAE